MKKFFHVLMICIMIAAVLGMNTSAFGAGCGHSRTTYLNSIKLGPIDMGKAHETIYYDVERCLDCGATIEKTTSVIVAGHDYYRTGDDHKSEGVHEIYYSCVCGSTYTATQVCFGYPCRIYYQGFEEPCVDK